MLHKQALLQHIIQPDEKLLLAKVLDQADFSLRKHQKIFSDFLDMEKCRKLESILCGIPDLTYEIFGGYEEAERKVIGFAPDYMDLKQADFPIDVLHMKKHPKFGQHDLSHRDYLGSILGLGVDRGKFGDILVQENETFCYVHREIADYVSSHLTKVSRTPVVTSILPIEECQIPAKKIEYVRRTISSLRLDAVIGAAFSISRGKAQDLIRAEKVTLNWSVIQNTSATVKEKDILSVRGYGRVRLDEIQGKTKKDRIGVVIGRYV